jgi:hypothetical protein
MLEVQMGVYLGGADVRMTEQFLHAAQIGARFQQMAGEGMTERVRMHKHA